MCVCVCVREKEIFTHIQITYPDTLPFQSSFALYLFEGSLDRNWVICTQFEQGILTQEVSVSLTSTSRSVFSGLQNVPRWITALLVCMLSRWLWLCSPSQGLGLSTFSPGFALFLDSSASENIPANSFTKRCLSHLFQLGSAVQVMASWKMASMKKPNISAEVGIETQSHLNSFLFQSCNFSKLFLLYFPTKRQTL